MKINSLKFNTFFQKKFVSKANILRDNQPYQCDIFQLEKKIDIDYFDKIHDDRNWKFSHYVDDAETVTNAGAPNEKTYVIEDKNQKCLGFVCITDYKETNTKEVDYLEVCPIYSNSNRKRTLKYIGETLLAFLAKQAKFQNHDELRVPYVMRNARGFYSKCGFREDNKIFDSAMWIKNDEYDKFISLNNQHTQV